MSPQLQLSSFLQAIRRRWRWLIGLRATTVALAGTALVLGVLAAVFWLARPAADALLALAVAAGVAIAIWIVRSVRPAFQEPSDQRLARFIEERRPEFDDALVSAVQASGGDTAFARALIADAAVQAGAVEPAAVIGRDELRQAAGRSVLACTLLLATGTASIEPLHRALDAARVRLFPSSLAIQVEPGDVRLVAGKPLTVKATVSGMPGGFEPAAIVVLKTDDPPRREQMARDGDGFRFEIPSVSTSFLYEVTVAGVRSREYRVVVLHRPAIAQIDVSYQYPPHTGMPPHVEQDGGDIYAPAGTQVTVRVRSNKPLQGGSLRLSGRAMPLAGAPDDQSRETTFVVTRDGSYRVELTDREGLKSEPSSEYFVRVTDDRPPEVRILRPEGDRGVTPLEEVQIAAAAEDDFRLSSLELVYAVGSQPEKVVSLSRSSAPSLAGGHLLYLENLEVQPGDVVRAYARAREAKRSGARQATSEMLLLTVMPFEQEFTLAQSQSGASGAGGQELESLIQGQKNIINATWNLLRRQAAGRSQADVDALATAQGELKQRAASLAGRVRVRSPQGAAPQDPMARAAAAMGRAEETLRRARLQQAVPHEMEALTELSRAEAENRQRQIQQQRSSGGGGGGNRSNVDLSALFDRELLRQQQTNYEDRNNSSSSSNREERESDAQRRIEELARRQDELARQQRDLAARRMTEEERRRQLERLTREQEELRREAEELAREMSRQGGSAGQRQQAEDLREAAEEMRAATGDLRRNDTQSASQRGSRAAEQLRGAERQGGSSAGGSQPQSAGELQMEAQQLADAQRRLESAARESDASGQQGESQGQAARQTGEADPQRQTDRRQQSGKEQESGAVGRGTPQQAQTQQGLAERADRLERDARALAGSATDPGQRRAATEAARELQRARVAERMRQNAERLRRGESGKNEEISSTLDRVAERLGASADAETRRLASELDKSRAARERLQEMQRKLERATREGDQAARGELSREIGRAEDMLRELESGGPESGAGRSTPEDHEFSTSAPGMESFKQDFSRWEQLKRDIELALERRDLAIADRLKGGRDKDTMSAGSVPSLPPSYRDKVARYFEMLAREGRRP
jgi:hypothetical protein